MHLIDLQVSTCKRQGGGGGSKMAQYTAGCPGQKHTHVLFSILYAKRPIAEYD